MKEQIFTLHQATEVCLELDNHDSLDGYVVIGYVKTRMKLDKIIKEGGYADDEQKIPVYKGMILYKIK